ncbi:MAG: acyloxyacyl hydrolase [Acetobacteraceae bacterium]
MGGKRCRFRVRAVMAPVLLAVAVCLAPGAAAHAQGRGYELWLGVLAHDVPIFGTHKESGPDINAELVLPSPISASAVAGIEPPLRWLLRPRPDIGVDANTAGDTSQAYIGLTWTADLASDMWSRGDGLFLDFSVGPALNNGQISTSDQNRKSLGSHVLIHSSVELGYRIEHVSVGLYLEHSSNAGLDDRNEGLTNVGVRLGFGF